MKVVAAIFCFSFLAGCAGMLTLPDEGSFQPKPTQPVVVVTWLAVDNPTTTCKMLFPDAMALHPIIVACAGWAKDQCTVVTGKVTTHQVLGHEVRHCFEGKYHD